LAGWLLPGLGLDRLKHGRKSMLANPGIVMPLWLAFVVAFLTDRKASQRPAVTENRLGQAN
jgi:hypothetical protein